MYKIMIVDDEAHICSLIRNLLDFDNLPITLTRCVTDGHNALNWILSEKPDIVIIDIQIGDVSGLDIISSVRNAGVKTNFIVVSGFSYFEYAKRALEYGVNHYLLKPIQEIELNDAVRNVTVKLDSQQAQQSERENLLRANKESQIRRFLTDLWLQPDVYLGSPIEQLLFPETTQGMLPDCYFYYVLHIEGDFDNGAAQQLIFPTFVRTLHDALDSSQAACIHAAVDNYNLVLLLQAPRVIKNSIQAAFRSAQYLTSQKFSSSGLRLFLASASPQPWADLLRGICWTKYCVKGRFLFSEDLIEEFDSSPSGATPVNLHKLEHQLSALSDSHSAEAVLNFCQDTYQRLLTSRDLFGFVDGLEAIIRLLTEHAVSAGISSSIGTKLSLLTSLNAQEYTNAFQRELSVLLQQLRKNNHSPNNQLITSVKEYMDKNYQDKITLESLASAVYLSPTYLSSLFKDVTGMSPTEYLTVLRIEKAQELLLQSNINVSEVSYAVGFSDPKYFAKVFRRIVGVKPTDYRRIRGRLQY